jgi:uncharacterized protein (TIGR04255 family)
MRVWEHIRQRLPITQPQVGMQVAIAGPLMQPQQPLRMLDRSRRKSVVIGPEAIIVEDTDYRCYGEFCDLLREVLDALAAADIAGFTRIGLRYVNEIRTVGASQPSDWDGLVHPALLASAALTEENMTIKRIGGEVEYATSLQHSVLLRYGSFEGRVVNIEGPLRTRTNDTSPAFLIDLDSYWEDTARSALPEFSVDAVMNTTSELRAPIKQLFELAISDELRGRFREEPT